MQVITRIEDLMRHRAQSAGVEALGFVPTMGYLHPGHLRLVEVAQGENAQVGVSMFVNPTQFGPREDFRRYPRDLPRDLALLGDAGVDWVLVPEPEAVYPPGFATYVEITGGLATWGEAQTRPGHFRGVATIVLKLFNLVRPQRAYFGQKDAQQLAVIRRMVEDLHLPVQVKAVATLREADGLAMSSRNVYLNPQEREAATILYRALEHAQRLVWQGQRSATALATGVERWIAEEPLARVDYVMVVDAETFAPVEPLERPVLLLMAVWIGQTRLIDNGRLEVETIVGTHGDEV